MKKGVREKQAREARKSKGTAPLSVVKPPKKRTSKGGKAKVADGGQSQPQVEVAIATEGYALRAGNASESHSARKKRPGVLEQMRARLAGGRFRLLNEALYTSDSQHGLQLFQSDPQAFQQYHEGYREQVSSWPCNPLDVIIRWIAKQPSSRVVADFGCGEARLSSSVPHTVHSLDFVAAAPNVIAGNMAQTPLSSSSVDIAVFCLSLMATDYEACLKEAHRVLKTGGSLLVAEVRSRFDPSSGGASLPQLMRAMQALGFDCSKQDASNKMFLLLFFVKNKDRSKAEKEAPSTIEWPKLKPCIYKRR